MSSYSDKTIASASIYEILEAAYLGLAREDVVDAMDMSHNYADELRDKLRAVLDENAGDMSWITDLARREDRRPIIIWQWQDVQSLRPEWDEEKCEDALLDARGSIEDRSTEVGWEVLETNIEWNEEEQ